MVEDLSASFQCLRDVHWMLLRRVGKRPLEGNVSSSTTTSFSRLRREEGVLTATGTHHETSVKESLRFFEPSVFDWSTSSNFFLPYGFIESS